MSTFYKKVCRMELYTAISCLVISVCIIFLSAVLRTIGHPVNWALDVALLLFTWSTFLGADVAYRHNQTVFVDILVNKLPEKFRKTLKLACYGIAMVFMVAMIYYGIILCFKSWARSFQGIPGFSYTWVTLSVPVSFFLMLITTLRKIYYEYIRHDATPETDCSLKGD